jgi:hypothetical protein
LKMSGSGLKLLNGFRSSVTGVKTIKLLLMLLLLALEISKNLQKRNLKTLLKFQMFARAFAYSVQLHYSY